MAACPYKKVMYNNETRVSEKCIACFPKIEQGYQPQCVTSCIGRIRIASFISQPDEVDPKKPIDFLVKVRKVALPLYPQAGTEPNVYYTRPSAFRIAETHLRGFEERASDTIAGVAPGTSIHSLGFRNSTTPGPRVA